ncbi:MAG TPA: DUF1223 domain-containing protein [Burkholderiales bacterium]|nr:DUF1223 domain-containing protein [Burkholderiales bacterium]
MESGPRTAALVELYTSEGCSSCPPADQQLRKLREALDPGADVVPLSLHVTYWNYIGWIDPFAQRAFDERQRWLVRVNGQRTLYTPQFFVGGTELRSVRAGLREQVRRVNGMPAAAAVRLHAQVLPGQRLALHASASARPGDSLALHVAIAESGLVSRVTRGENADATLEHDHVVRAWIGPVPLGPEGASIRRDVSLAPGWKHENLEIAAFVQHERTGRVLQAVGGHCAG